MLRISFLMADGKQIASTPERGCRGSLRHGAQTVHTSGLCKTGARMMMYEKPSIEHTAPPPPPIRGPNCLMCCPEFTILLSWTMDRMF